MSAVREQYSTHGINIRIEKVDESGLLVVLTDQPDLLFWLLRLVGEHLSVRDRSPYPDYLHTLLRLPKPETVLDVFERVGFFHTPTKDEIRDIVIPKSPHQAFAA